MKNSLFVVIYMLVVGVVFIIQATRINKLKGKIKENEMLKKEIYKLGDNISLIHNKQDVYDYILKTSIRLIGKGNKGIILIKDSEGFFNYKTIRGFNKTMESIKLRKEDIDLYKYNECKDIAILNDIKGDTSNSILSSPIYYDGRLIGIISIYISNNELQFNEEDIKTMKYIRHELELVIKNFIIQDRLKHIANHDELTNLYNRRAFNRIFEEQIDQIRKNKGEKQLALIDLDDFKIINDTYGHRVGDKALIIMANAMKKCLSSSDIYARISGDEFVIIFTNSNYIEAEKKILTIREELRDNNSEIKADFTYGLVSIDPNTKLDKDEILSQADTMMYKAKKHRKVGR